MPYTALEHRLGLSRPLPYTPDWSAAPDFLGLVAEHCLSKKPSVIVECSSGTSTLVLARCCQINGHGHVFSLENGAEYANATSRMLAESGLDGYASVMHAPLVEYDLNGHQHAWYSLDKLKVQAIDLLVIDGPPAVVNPEARYPALPLLHERLGVGCVVYLDDASRHGERAIVARWYAMFPEFRVQVVECERGCAVLEKPLGKR
jgi:predicted O-methyltransferase YrrM